MPIFYFNIRDDQDLICDEEGMELPNLDAAREEAQEGARQLLLDALRAHREVNGKKIEIANESGFVIEAIKVRDLLG
jgi:hypothetical protein